MVFYDNEIHISVPSSRNKIRDYLQCKAAAIVYPVEVNDSRVHRMGHDVCTIQSSVWEKNN